MFVVESFDEDTITIYNCLDSSSLKLSLDELFNLLDSGKKVWGFDCKTGNHCWKNYNVVLKSEIELNTTKFFMIGGISSISDEECHIISLHLKNSYEHPLVIIKASILGKYWAFDSIDADKDEFDENIVLYLDKGLEDFSIFCDDNSRLPDSIYKLQRYMYVDDSDYGFSAWSFIRGIRYGLNNNLPNVLTCYNDYIPKCMVYLDGATPQVPDSCRVYRFTSENEDNILKAGVGNKILLSDDYELQFSI